MRLRADRSRCWVLGVVGCAVDDNAGVIVTVDTDRQGRANHSGRIPAISVTKAEPGLRNIAVSPRRRLRVR